MPDVSHDDRELLVFCAECEDEAVHIISERVFEEARATAPREGPATRPAGRGSFPRVPPGYLARALTTRYGDTLDHHRYGEVGASDPAAATLINYRGGLGGPGAYGGSRRRDPFLSLALEAQEGREVP